MTDDFEEPVVLGEYDPVPGPESQEDLRRMREDAKATLAGSSFVKDGVRPGDKLTTADESYTIDEVYPKTLVVVRDVEVEEDGSAFWFYFVVILVLLVLALVVVAHLFGGLS